MALAVLACVGCGRREPAWEPLPLGSASAFRAIWFVDANSGWIGGGSFSVPGGLVGRTTDGGQTWRFVSGLTSVTVGRAGVDVAALHFLDQQQGLAATTNGRILRTEDGGETWAVVRDGRGVRDAVFDFSFTSDRDGWAVGLAGLVRTNDGGETWTGVPSSAEPPRMFGRSLHMLSHERGWIVGMHATLLGTSSGGAEWTEFKPLLPSSDEPPDFLDVFFIGDDMGWVVGEEGTILATRDGGVTWTLQDSGVGDARSAAKLERIPTANGVATIDAGDRTPGLTFGAVRFVDARRGWIVGRYANHGRSVILRTDNGGATWTVDATIEGEDLMTLTHAGGRLWTVGEHIGPGAQAAYWRQVDGAN